MNTKSQVKRPRKLPPHRRRGSLYLIVLGAVMIVSLIGLAAMQIVRVQLRATTMQSDTRAASMLAMAAVEDAISRINRDPSWRSAHLNNVEYPQSPSPPVALGSGTFTYKLVDEGDNNINNNSMDPVRVYGIGRAGKSVRTYSVYMVPKNEGLQVLKSAVHTGGNVTIKANTTAFSGPVSSNATLTVSAFQTLNGNAQAMSISNSGTITGTQTILTSPKTMPSPGVFDTYRSMATTINYSSIPGGVIEEVILSSTSNPYGATTNPNGIYYIRIATKSELRIQNCRIRGTLLTEVDDKSSLRVKKAVVWEPHSPTFPSLIAKSLVTSKADVEIDGEGSLYESSFLKNFNPPGMPFNGAENTNMTDVYPATLKGLFHVIRPSSDSSVTVIRGTVSRLGTFLIDGTVELEGQSFTADSSLVDNAPQGYSTATRMQPVAGSWRWNPSP